MTNVRGRFAHGGVEAVLHDKLQQHRHSAFSGLQTAHLIAVACSPAPDGHDHWMVRLLAQKADEAALRRQVLAVETERNAHHRGIAWQFTSRDARRKLERLYPVKENASD